MLTSLRDLNDPCIDWCQYAKDVGMDTNSCGGQFCDHYTVRNNSEEMLALTCWLHGQTLWRLEFDTLWWECPMIDECDSRVDENRAMIRKIPAVIVPPLFGFSRALS